MFGTEKRERGLSSHLPSSPTSSSFLHKKSEKTMAATPDTNKQDDSGEDQVLSYQPLAENSAVSANPHIPSVTASAVLGESESVSTLCHQIDLQ